MGQITNTSSLDEDKTIYFSQLNQETIFTYRYKYIKLKTVQYTS